MKIIVSVLFFFLLVFILKSSHRKRRRIAASPDECIRIVFHTKHFVHFDAIKCKDSKVWFVRVYGSLLRMRAKQNAKWNPLHYKHI